MYGRKDGICVDAGATATGVGGHVPGRGRPIRLGGMRGWSHKEESTCLEETEDIVGLGGVLGRRGRVADGRGKGGALTEGAVLHGRGEERGRVDFLPEVKGGLVPVAGDIVEVELDDGPERVGGVGRVSVGGEPVGVSEEGGRAEGGAVALGTAPRTGERGLVDVELGLAEAPGRDGPARVWDLLERRLCVHEEVDEGAQGVVLGERVLVDETLEDEGRVADPGVEVVWVGRARARDDHAWLVRVSGARRGGESVLTYAPEESAPSGPMLARMPACARGDSEAIKESTWA